MNRKIFVVLVLAFSTMYGYSQLSWNVKGGLNLSNVAGSGGIDLKPGYQLGVGMDYFFSDSWGVQSSLMVISKGYQYETDYSGFGYGYGDNNPDYVNPFEGWKSGYYKENRVYLELPVMLARRFDVSHRTKFIVSGGGYIGYGVGGKYQYTITLDDGSKKDISEIDVGSAYYWDWNNKSTFQEWKPKFDTGLAVGIALEFNNRYTIGLFGHRGLKDIGRSKNQSLGLNVGYKF
jgi:hypothetical protein